MRSARTPKRGPLFRARDTTDEFVAAFNFSVVSRSSYLRRAVYFAVPSQPELSTLQAARRPGPRRGLAFCERFRLRRAQICRDRPADAGGAVSRVHRDGEALIFEGIDNRAEFLPDVLFRFLAVFERLLLGLPRRRVIEAGAIGKADLYHVARERYRERAIGGARLRPPDGASEEQRET
jgi:hypothetical protein